MIGSAAVKNALLLQTDTLLSSFNREFAKNRPSRFFLRQEKGCARDQRLIGQIITVKVMTPWAG